MTSRLAQNMSMECYFLLLKIDSEAILQVRVVARPYVISQGRFRGHFLRLNFTHYGRIYGENREFGGEYFVWAKKFQISKKYFRIFQKSLDISEIEISFPTSNAEEREGSHDPLYPT